MQYSDNVATRTTYELLTQDFSECENREQRMPISIHPDELRQNPSSPKGLYSHLDFEAASRAATRWVYVYTQPKRGSQLVRLCHRLPRFYIRNWKGTWSQQRNLLITPRVLIVGQSPCVAECETRLGMVRGVLIGTGFVAGITSALEVVCWVFCFYCFLDVFVIGIGWLRAP
jgi:hypothetical protein